jgi:hypothetical protein
MKPNSPYNDEPRTCQYTDLVLLFNSRGQSHSSSKISQVLKLFTSISNALEISSLFLKYITKTGLTTEAEGHRKTTQHGILHCLAGVRGPCKPWRGAAQLGASGNTSCCCSCCRYSLLLNVHEAPTSPKSRKRRQGPAIDVQ